MKSSEFKVQSSTLQDRARRRRPPVFNLRTSNFELPIRAFTLVEMMVVVAIIALLLAALLPAFSAVKTQAKYAQASAQFKALDTGINAFRAEAALGGALPPSSSDNPDHRQKIADPKATTPTTLVRIAGAHLLVEAMIGADGLGTPGFRDINRDPKGLWSDDTHKKLDNSNIKQCGIYAVGDSGDTAGKEKFPRYGGAGYVDEKMKERAESIQDLVNEGKIVYPTNFGDIAVNERMFMDPWDHPILYYKANPTALRMAGAQAKPGIYWQEDNGVITGTAEGLYTDDGLDFGQGKERDYYHNIAIARGVDPTVAQDANWIDTVRTDPAYDHSFVRFILDASIKARPTPVQKDTYLLISAGPDARYGTYDDVINWTRKTN